MNKTRQFSNNFEKHVSIAGLTYHTDGTTEHLNMRFTEAKLGRLFVLRLHDDDHLPDVLESFAAEHNVNSAICFFLGGAKDNSRIVVGPRNGNETPPEPMVTLLKGVHETCGVGTIFEDQNGKPKLHMHASFGRKEETITGCVRLGVDVWHIGEVVMLELMGASACRAVDKETGFEFLECK
jgi:predicted DNA-binding protein with PD1-like motif